MSAIWEKVGSALSSGHYVPALFMFALIVFSGEIKGWSLHFRSERASNNDSRRRRHEQENVDQASLIVSARYIVSTYLKLKTFTTIADFTDQQAYLVISPHLEENARRFIEDRVHGQYRERLERLNEEINRLALDWKTFN